MSEITVQDLKRNWIHLPGTLFIEKLSPTEFGARVLYQLRSPEGLGKPIDQSQAPGLITESRIAVLGEAFAAGLSPIEIAVYCYFVYNPEAKLSEVAKKRKLSVKLVQKALSELYDWGFIAQKEDGTLSFATLEDLYTVSAE